MRASGLLLLLLISLSFSVYGDHLSRGRFMPDLPRDAIPPLDHPQYDPVSQVAWLSDDDWVIGFERRVSQAKPSPVS